MVLNFNSRPSARGDRRGGGNINYTAISIHAPPRGATLWRNKSRYSKNISIHAPPRGATAVHPRSAETQAFQFTPLREGRLFQVFCIPTEEIFQFTPLREGRHTCLSRHTRRARISIHAPPRGATRRTREKKSSYSISIHAPPRGATRLSTL